MNDILAYFEASLRNRYALFRGHLLKLYLLLHGCSVGTKLKCQQWPLFRTTPTRNIRVGNNVTIGYRITFELHGNGLLSIGDNVNLTQDILISVSNNISIGSETLVGEQVSIRDADHGTHAQAAIFKQPLSTLPVTIGKDVWIGAGCRILKGSSIPDGAIIGANSIVLAKNKLHEHGIHAGIPLRFIRSRE